MIISRNIDYILIVQTNTHNHLRNFYFIFAIDIANYTTLLFICY